MGINFEKLAMVTGRNALPGTSVIWTNPRSRYSLAPTLLSYSALQVGQDTTVSPVVSVVGGGAHFKRSMVSHVNTSHQLIQFETLQTIQQLSINLLRTFAVNIDRAAYRIADISLVRAKYMRARRGFRTM